MLSDMLISLRVKAGETTKCPNEARNLIIFLGLMFFRNVPTKVSAWWIPSGTYPSYRQVAGHSGTPDLRGTITTGWWFQYIYIYIFVYG